MTKKAINTDSAPAAIGPYSQAVLAGDFLFTSGQVAIDPAGGELVSGDVAAQTERVMENLKAVLAAAEMGFEDVVKATIYLKSMDDFTAVNGVYGGYFEEEPPARATVEVARLPLDVLVEIDCIAYKG
ncbi:MAG: RidA family protein [bacterium]|nr:RidA family protein [bacterium]